MASRDDIMGFTAAAFRRLKCAATDALAQDAEAERASKVARAWPDLAGAHRMAPALLIGRNHSAAVPNAVLGRIASFLYLRDLVYFTRTCKHWKRAMDSNHGIQHAHTCHHVREAFWRSTVARHVTKVCIALYDDDDDDDNDEDADRLYTERADKVIHAVAQHMPRVRSLEVRDCEGYLSTATFRVLRMMPRLTHLDLELDADQTDVAKTLLLLHELRTLRVYSIARGCARLLFAHALPWTELRVRNVMDADSLKRLHSALPQLQRLGWMPCRGMHTRAMGSHLQEMDLITPCVADETDHFDWFVINRLDAFVHLTTLRMCFSEDEHSLFVHEITSAQLVHAFATLSRLTNVRIEYADHLTSLAFLEAVAPQLQQLVITWTRLAKSSENMNVLYKMTRIEHLELDRAFAVNVFPMELAPFMPPLRERLFPHMRTFKYTERPVVVDIDDDDDDDA